jgi:L-ascorbate metabolism protein UlaG (beta-lactamase superfamily)
MIRKPLHPISVCALPLLLLAFATIAWGCHAQSKQKNPLKTNYMQNNTDMLATPSGESLYITFLRHASLILTFNNKVIYVDPLKEYFGKGQYPKADAVLITHDHYDHFEPATIKEISKPDTRVVLNKDAAGQLGRGTAMRNGDSLKLFDDVELEAVPAYNTTPGHTQFHPRGRDNGYVLTLGGLRVYISGDTEDIPELGSLKNIDVAFLPVNQPYTMTLEQACRAVRTIRPKVFYPYHFGDTRVDRLPAMLSDTKIKVVLHDMQ